MGQSGIEDRVSNDPLSEHGRRFLEATTDLLVVGEVGGGVLWVNEDAWERTLGIPGEQLLDRGYLDFLHPDDHKETLDVVARVAEGEHVSQQNRYRSADGSYRWLLWDSICDREAGLIYCLAKDITELRATEDELARSASMHKATVESTTDGILVVDSEGTVLSWNRNFLDMWRIPADLADERDDEKLIKFVLEQLRDPGAFALRVRELYESPDQESFDVLEFKDGRVFERYSKPQRLDDEVVGRVWSFRDVSNRLRAEHENLALEARLQQSQRLESLGRLAGGIAHDFNNHLVAILNYAALAGEDLPETAPARADLDEVIRAAERASALTRELVAFSRQEMAEPKALSLNELVSDTDRLLQRTIGEDVELRLELGTKLPAIEADSSQLERVLMNLAVNARDAMPDGGTLLITTEALGGDDDQPDAGISGALVRLRIRDDGAGMSEDVAKRAIEPFFTTKPSGEGTGLGLATVYGIVNQSRGHMSIESEPKGGTTITIDFPASEKPPETASRPERPDPKASERGTVVVVEDEAPVRRLTARLLRDAGFRTLEASRGSEALWALEQEDPGDLCLLLTDIVMPQMSGRELAERVQELRPELPVLFISGYTDDVVVRHGVAADDFSFLAKPFTRETLITAVNEVLAARSE